ncbi:MAG: SelB C-terminal domain-containing protein, partial [Calditerrivibrio sp.]|nr:SelB C-terminal domain-containing protein [Calditerrivibrio sp.]
SVLSGELKVQDTIFLMPADKRVKVKGLSVHGKKVHSVEAGDRAAINLADIEVRDLNRGDILTSMKLKNHDTCYCLIEKFSNNFDFKIKHNGIYNIFIGTTFLNVRFNILKEWEGNVFVRMKILDNFYPFIIGEKFLIRISNPKMTVSGGTVLFPQELHTSKSNILGFLNSLLNEDRIYSLCNYLEFSGHILRNEIYQSFLLEEDYVLQNEVVIPYGEYFVSAKLFNYYIEKSRSILFDKGYFDIQNDLDKIDSVLGRLVVEKLLEFAKGLGFCLVDNKIQKSSGDFEDIVSKVLECMSRDVGMSNQKIISLKLSIDENIVVRVLKFLSNKGEIKKIDKDGNYILTDLLKKFIKDAALLAKKDGFVDIGNVREIIDAPRKILIPLLEILDGTDLFKNLNNRRYLK